MCNVYTADIAWYTQQYYSRIKLQRCHETISTSTIINRISINKRFGSRQNNKMCGLCAIYVLHITQNCVNCGRIVPNATNSTLLSNLWILPEIKNCSMLKWPLLIWDLHSQSFTRCRNGLGRTICWILGLISK